MTIEAIVFDVDGVLVHAGEFGKALAERHGIDREAQAAFFGGPFRDCVLGRADLKEAIAPFLTEWGWPGSVDDIVNFWFESDSKVNDEVLRVAADLRQRGYRCFVASTQERHRASYLEDVVGLAQRFDALFFSCRVGHTKGDTRFYAHVAAEIGRDGHEILFLDDVDVIVNAARSAGWNAEMYAFGDDISGILSRYGVAP